MKTVTIENWDGSKYNVEAPDNAKYVGILCNTGCINFYAKKPRLRYGYYDNRLKLLANGIYGACREENLPKLDGYGSCGMPSELLLKIEEV